MNTQEIQDIRSKVKPERIAEVENFFEMAKEFPHLCTSCGMCEGVCPTDAIKMKTNEYTQFVPEFIQENCVYCRKCIICCPGIDITNDAEDIGDYDQLLLGYANDEQQRSQGASGGVVTALAAWMLQEGIIEKSIMLNSAHSPVVPEVVVNTTLQGINESSESKYVISPTCTAVKEFDSKTLITTLPCQATAMKKMRKNQGYIFGLLCSGAQTQDLIKYVSQKEGIDPNEIKQVKYREGDWPGNVSIQTDSQKILIPLIRSYYTAAVNGGHFSVQGCALCPDYFAENADISFGDPWGIDHAPAGKTLLIVRTQKGRDLIQKAHAAGVITLEPVTEEDVRRGHKAKIHLKKKTLHVRLKMLQEMGLPLPKHNKDLAKKYNIFDALVHRFYLRNNFKLKKNYARLFKFSRQRLFVERYIVHVIHTIYLKILWRMSSRKPAKP
jgi:coenzyme F420 hydrogenase subunit beta